VRVAYLNPCGQLGGAETSLRELLAGVRTEAPHWDLWLVLGEDGPIAAEARALGVNVVVAALPPVLARLGDSPGSLPALLGNLLGASRAALQYRRALAAILDRIQPNIIHTNGFKMHALGAWIHRRRTALVWHIHDYVSPRPTMSRLLRLLQKACTVAIVNSNSVAADVRSLLPKLRVVPLYNAVDLQRFSPAGARLDLDMLSGLEPAGPETIRIGLIATFARWKGQEIFLQAMARLSGETGIRGYIIGGPIYQTDNSQWSLGELQARAAQLGLSSRVGFTGFVADTSAAMRSLDIVVHASTQPEPFGMVIAEAMACGTALIASQAGGAAELFVAGENALGHAPGDAAALAEQMRRLATGAALRSRLGAAARNAAVKRYDRRRLARELLEVYQEIAGNALTTGQAAEMQSCTVAE